MTDDLVERLEELARISPISGYAPLVREAIAKLSAQGPRLPEVIVLLSAAHDDWVTAADDDYFSNDDAAMRLSNAISDVVAAFLPTPQGHDSSAPLEPEKAEDAAGELLPCPFCGSAPRWFDGSRLFAGELRCSCGAMFEDKGGKSSTFAAWNTRTPAVTPDHRDDSCAQTKQTTTPKADGETLEGFAEFWKVWWDRKYGRWAYHLMTTEDLYQALCEYHDPSRKLDERAA